MLRFVLLVIAWYQANAAWGGAPKYEKPAPCNDSATVCEFSLVITSKLTLYEYRKKMFVVNGTLVDQNLEECKLPSCNPADVLSVDGWQPGKLVSVYNGSLPGPPIEVWKGQTVRVTVHNKLKSETTSIHWHGVYQRGTPWMDGVARLTACPILPGASFTYEFNADPVGTHWYHSHVGAQRIDGLFGALIVRERTHTPSLEHVLVLNDYDHRDGGTAAYEKMVHGHYVGDYKMWTAPRSFKNAPFSGVMHHSTLINGKGRYWENGTYTAAPLSIFTVRKDSTYRFRVIHGGSLYPFRVSIDEHKMTLVASDGAELEAVEIESFICSPGERFDVIVTFDKGVDNFWFRAETLAMDVPYEFFDGLAIIRYEGAVETEPSDQPDVLNRGCTAQNRCKVANCPFTHFAADKHSDCLLFGTHLKRRMPTTVEKSGTSSDLPAPRAPDVTHFLNFAFPGTSFTPGSVNGRALTDMPDGSVLTQKEDRKWLRSCSAQEDPTCGKDKVCDCPLSIVLEHEQIVEMVLMNLGSGNGWAHPIHIHGHHFYVLKTNWGEYNESTGEPRFATTYGMSNDDITCLGGNQDEAWDNYPFCNEAKFTNDTWGGDNTPGLEFDKAPLKDSLYVPRGGYAVVRIRADNPGIWFMHCHVEVHAEDGMAMFIVEGLQQLDELIESKMPPMTKCGSNPDVLLEPSRKCDENKYKSNTSDEIVNAAFRLSVASIVTTLLVSHWLVVAAL
eukprot:TRINITY_DN38943_c0_g2_i1.p1 TRINITY_DN38943_c0_g2~~TRINITY_DN38943_c0_g2_i1.p1  ORF type:complete len:728 (-),score=102.44 TRINITY_DN38943_c0_g2_i1:347-2530(-)